MTKRQQLLRKLDGFAERQRERQERRKPALAYLRAYGAGYRAGTRAALQVLHLREATWERERLSPRFPNSGTPIIEAPRWRT